MKTFVVLLREQKDGSLEQADPFFVGVKSAIDWMAQAQDDGLTTHVMRADLDLQEMVDITQLASDRLFDAARQDGSNWIHPLSGIDQPDPDAVPQDPYKEHRFGHHEYGVGR